MAVGDALNLAGYRLTFDDEFNTFSSNGPSNYQIQGETSGTWDTTISYGERWLNDETEMYSDPTVGPNPDSVSNGVLDIHAAPSADPSKTEGQSYTSGVITTNHSFNQEYGYFEMRAELPTGAGMWPAFWLLPQVHTWPPELDPLEGFGAENAGGEGGAFSFHNGLVTSDPNNPNQGGWNSTNGANLYTQYNTFGVQWTPTSINFFFNGVEYATEATPSDFHQSMYMLANLAVGGSWAGAPTGESADLKIDYIRAFSNDGANPAVAQQVISSPDGGGFNFYGATDANGKGALGGTSVPTQPVVPGHPINPAAVVVGTGVDTLALSVSEDAYQGDAQFIVTVDGKQVGGTLTTTAVHASGASQEFDIKGTFTPGPHTVAVNFLNDLYGGAAGLDRNLYVTAASLDGATIKGASLTEMSSGSQSIAFQGPAAVALPPTTPGNPVTVKIGSGAQTLALSVSEDRYQGDAQFTVSVDGTQIGGTQTATASHGAGQEQIFDVLGDFGAGNHTVSINFLNDAWAGSAATDRNLFVDGATIDKMAVSGSALSLMSSGAQSFTFSSVVPTAPTGAKPTTDTIELKVSEDAWQGDAEFVVSINGQTVGGVYTATAAHSAGATQDILIGGAWGAGAKTIGISFINDAYGGTAATDRNLYVSRVTYDGQNTAGAPVALMSNGIANFTTAPSTMATALIVNLSEDAWQGNAQYSIAVDGNAPLQSGEVSASHAQGQSLAVHLTAALSVGTHDVSVSFLNDAYGGTATTDRNLYVTGMSINGAAVPGSVASLMSAGTDHFQVVVPPH